jgi:hypothetical protein
MNNSILGIFLLLLAVSGNFIAETLGCKTQKLLSTNMYAKNIIIILITYFSLGLSNNKEIVSPLVNFKNAILIWGAFLIFNKMSLIFTILAFGLITIKLVLYNYIEYYNKKGYTAKAQKLETYYSHLFNLNIGVITIGFLLYLKKQHKEYNSKFNILKFIFGTVKCKSV